MQGHKGSQDSGPAPGSYGSLYRPGTGGDGGPRPDRSGREPFQGNGGNSWGGRRDQQGGPRQGPYEPWHSPMPEPPHQGLPMHMQHRRPPFDPGMGPPGLHPRQQQPWLPHPGMPPAGFHGTPPGVPRPPFPLGAEHAMSPPPWSSVPRLPPARNVPIELRADPGTHPQTQQHIQPPQTSLLPWQLKQAQQPTPELKAEAPAAASQAAEAATAADSQPVAVKAESVRSEEAQEEPTASEPHKQELMPEPEKLEPSGPVSFGFSKKTISRPKVLKANPALAARPRAAVAPAAASSGGASQPAAASGPEANREGRPKSRWGVDLGVKAEPAITPTSKTADAKGSGAQEAAAGPGALAADVEPSAAAKAKPEAASGAANSSAAAGPAAAAAEGVKAAKDFAAELSEQLRAKMAASAQASPAGAAAQNGMDVKHSGSPHVGSSRGARGSPSAGRSPVRPVGSRAAAREGSGRSPARRAGSGAAAAREDGPRSRRSPAKDAKRSPARDLHRKRGRSRTASRSPAGRPSSKGVAAAGAKAAKPKAAEGPSSKSPAKGSDGKRTPVAKRRSLSPVRGSDARRQRRSAPKRSSPSPARGGAGGASRRRQSEREEGEMSAGPSSQSPPRADKRRRVSRSPTHRFSAHDRHRNDSPGRNQRSRDYPRREDRDRDRRREDVRDRNREPDKDRAPDRRRSPERRQRAEPGRAARHSRDGTDGGKGRDADTPAAKGASQRRRSQSPSGDRHPVEGLGDVSRTADRRASDAEAKALRLQRWKERNAGSSLVGTGSGSADGKSQPAAVLGTHHGHGGHRSRSQSKSPPARRRHSSQEDGELAGGPEDLWSAKATADGPQRPSWVDPSPEQRAAFEQLSQQVSTQMGPWLAALGLEPDEVLGNAEAIGGHADEVCTSETGIFGFLHTSYFKPTYLSFWDSMHDGPQMQPEMFFLDIDRFPDGQAKLLEDGSPVMICPRHDVNTSEYLQLQRLLMPGMESDFQCKREAPQWMPRWWRCPVIASDDLRPRVVERESPDNPREFHLQAPWEKPGPAVTQPRDPRPMDLRGSPPSTFIDPHVLPVPMFAFWEQMALPPPVMPGAEDCKVDQLQPGSYRYWLLNLGARQAESDGSWANGGENRVEGEGEVLSRPGSGEHLEHLDPPPAPLRNTDEPPPPPPGAMQDVRWQHHMAGMQQGQQPLPWQEPPGQQQEPAAPADPESGLWRFLRDGKLTDKMYTMAELRDRIDYGDRDPVWGGLVCRESDSLWLHLREARWTPEDLAVQSAAMQGQQRAAAPQTAAARGHGLAAADPADDPNLSPEQQSSPYLRHWFEDQRVHARKLAQQLAASEAAGSAPAASWASEAVLSPASLQAEDAGLLNGLTDATWFASFDQAAAQQRQVKQLAAAQAAEAAAADSAAVAAQQPAPAAGPAAEQAGVGDAAAVQVPPHVLAAVQGRLLLETFGSKQGAQQGGMMLISNLLVEVVEQQQARARRERQQQQRERQQQREADRRRREAEAARSALERKAASEEAAARRQQGAQADDAAAAKKRRAAEGGSVQEQAHSRRSRFDQLGPAEAPAGRSEEPGGSKQGVRTLARQEPNPQELEQKGSQRRGQGTQQGKAREQAPAEQQLPTAPARGAPSPAAASAGGSQGLLPAGAGATSGGSAVPLAPVPAQPGAEGPAPLPAAVPLSTAAGDQTQQAVAAPPAALPDAGLPHAALQGAAAAAGEQAQLLGADHVMPAGADLDLLQQQLAQYAQQAQPLPFGSPDASLSSTDAGLLPDWAQPAGAAAGQAAGPLPSPRSHKGGRPQAEGGQAETQPSGKRTRRQSGAAEAPQGAQSSGDDAGASTPESPQPDWARGTSSAAAAAADAASSDIPEEARIELAEYEALKESLRIKMEPEAVRDQQGKLWNSLVKFDRASCEEMFRSRIDDSIVAGYTSVIAVPMSLDTIKEKRVKGQYPLTKQGLEAVKHDLDLISSNCKQYWTPKLQDPKNASMAKDLCEMADRFAAHAEQEYDAARKAVAEAVYLAPPTSILNFVST